MRTSFFVAAASALVLIFGCTNPTTTSSESETDRALVGPTPVSYYVANNGNNNNPGTAAAPFKTITYGLAKAAALNTPVGTWVFVHVAPGTYNQQNAEVFPLIIPARVQLIGDITHSGNGPVPTKIIGEGLVPGSSTFYATLIAQDDSSIAGLWVTTNNLSTVGRHFAIDLNGVGIVVAYCIVVRSETGIYAPGNVEVSIHNSVIEKNNVGIQFIGPTPSNGQISTVYSNSIRYNSWGVQLSLQNGGIVPDLGGAKVGEYQNQISGPTPVYGKGVNVIAWNDFQDLSINYYSGTTQQFALFARNNSWSQVTAGGNSGGKINSSYPGIGVDTSNATQAPSTPSAF